MSNKILVACTFCMMALSCFSGWKEDGISEATLDSSTAAGTVLKTNTVYRVTRNVTIAAGASTNGLVVLPGVTVLDIAEGCTLRVWGGEASVKAGAGAGIRLQSGAALVVTGPGSLWATGGVASLGEDGYDGGASVDGNKGRARGGSGGHGGGGAGAGIGGSGGIGGEGGDGVEVNVEIGLSESIVGCNGSNGNAGNPGTAGADCGDLVLLGDLDANIGGGGEASGDSESGHSSASVPDVSFYKEGFLFFNTRTLIAILSGSSGSGGGGYPGSDAPYFGRGGSGGGGGGAGGSSGVVCACAKNFVVDRILDSLAGKVVEFVRWLIKGKKKGLSKDQVWKVVNAFRKMGWIEEATGGYGGGWRAEPQMGRLGRSTMNLDRHDINGGQGGNAGATPSYEAPTGKLFYADRVRLNYSGGEINQKVVRSGSTYASGIFSEIDFNQQGGTGGPDTVKAELGMPMPPVARPTKPDYVFCGYYTEPDGKGSRYYSGGGTSVRSWDIACERVTLYAKWEPAGCGIRVNWKDPSTTAIPGVTYYPETRIVSLDESCDDYIVSGTAEGGERLLMRCVAICISNLTIRLPPQTAEELKLYAEMSPEAAYCRSPLTICHSNALVSARTPKGFVQVNHLGENTLIAEETEEPGGPDTAVPAISLRSWNLNEYFGLILEPGLREVPYWGFGRLKLRAAGGAPGICVKADMTGRMGVDTRCCQGRWIPVMMRYGTYDIAASQKIYDSGLRQYREYQSSYSPPIGIDGSLRCFLNCDKADESIPYWDEFTLRWFEKSRPDLRYCSAALTQSAEADPIAVNCSSGRAGEVLVDLESDYEDNMGVSVVVYTDSSFSKQEDAFESILPIRGCLRLWLEVDTNAYFTVDGVRYWAHPVAEQTVEAQRIYPRVKHVETGTEYGLLSDALAKAAEYDDATLRLLRDVSDEEIVCSVDGGRRLVIDGSGHVLSNACQRMNNPMFKVGREATFVLINTMVTGFSSVDVPMMLNLGRMEVRNCRLCGNDVGPVGTLVSSESSVTNGVDFEAFKVQAYHNVCANAIQIDSPHDEVQTLLRSGSVDSACSNGLYVISGRVDLDEGVHSITPVRLGCAANLAYRDAAPSSVRVTLDDPARQCWLEAPVIVNAYDHPVAATNVFVTNPGYGCYNNARGDVLLSADEIGTAFVAFDDSSTNTLYCERFAEFDDYADLPADFGPTVSVWATRWVNITSGATNEGSTCSIVITNGLYVDFGSVEYAQTNGMVVLEDWECAPVVLDGPVIVDGTLRLGNVIFSDYIILGTNATLIVGDEYPTNVPIRVAFRDPLGCPRIVSGRPLEGILKLIVPKQRRYRPRIRDGKEIVFDESKDEVVWLGTEQGKRLYKSISNGFANTLTNDVAHLLSRPGSTVVGLDWETRLGDGKRLVVNSGVFNGTGWEVGGMTTLDATEGSLLIGEDSSVQLTNILVSGTLRLGGEGVLDLAGWTGDPVAVAPERNGRIAANVPVDKLVLGSGVKGLLWRTGSGDVYYGSKGLVEWEYDQTKNGEATLFVTNILGETTNILLNAERYASITNAGVAHVQLDFPKLEYSTNLTVYVFYLDDETGRVFVPDADGYEFMNDDGNYEKFKFFSIAELKAAIDALDDGVHSAEDGDEELRMKPDGTIVTNRPSKAGLAAGRFTEAKIRLAVGPGDIMAFFPLNTYINLAEGQGLFKWAGKKVGIDLLDLDKRSEQFADCLNGAVNYGRLLSAFVNGEDEDGVLALLNQFNITAPWAARKTCKLLKKGNFKNKGLGPLVTRGGVQAICSLTTGLLKHQVTPVQYKGKYYFRYRAPTAYERCIADDDSDAAVHIQSTCRLPPYVQTNGTLRLSGKYEGGMWSALYGLVTNGKQWTSGTHSREIAAGFVNEGQRLAYSIYLAAWRKEFEALATEVGGWVGNFLAQTIKTVAGPYGATSKDKSKPLFTVKNGATLKMKRMSLRGKKDSGAQVSVEDGGTAECDDIKLKDGYTLGDVDGVKGVYTVKSGGTLTLKDITAFEDCDVLCVEDGAKSMTLDDGDFDDAGFVLNGDALTMKSKPGGDGVKVSGARSGRGTAFAQKGDTDTDDWEDFKSASDESLKAEVVGESVVWKLGDPIGNVQGGKLPAAIEFGSMGGATTLIGQAGDGAVVTMTKEKVEVPKDWSLSVSSGKVTFNGGGGDNFLSGNGKKRERPLFSVSNGGRLILKNLNLRKFKGKDTSLVSADGGTLDASACTFDENKMASLFVFANQASCTSKITSVTFKKDDDSDYAIRSDASGSTNRTIFVSGTFDASLPVRLTGKGSVRIGKSFASDRFYLHDSAALAYPDGTPDIKVGVLGEEDHLEGRRFVVDNSLSSTKASPDSFRSLNLGYVVTNRVDGNLYLYDPRDTPQVATNELLYTWSNDVFSVMSGYVPSVADTNWTARTVAGTNAVFNAGRIARDAYVNTTNGNLVVCCQGTNFTMSALGATTAQTYEATTNVLALVNDILRDGTAWFDGTVVSNATKKALEACVTRRELEVTAAEMTNALWVCAARFKYEGRFYLESTARDVFDLASQSMKPVYLLRNANVDPYELRSGTLNLIAPNIGFVIFDSDVLRGDVIVPWSDAAQIDAELDRMMADPRCGIYSTFDFEPALTVMGNTVACLTGIVCTNVYPCEMIRVEFGGRLKVDGDTRLTSVEADLGAAVEGLEEFTGAVGLSGHAANCGVTFGKNRTIHKGTGVFYSNANDFHVANDGQTSLMWVLPPGKTLDDFKPRFAEEEPLSITFDADDMHHVVVSGKVVNVESGLWYGFASSTNLTEEFVTVTNSMMSTTSGDHRFHHDFYLETNDVGRVVQPAGFFKFRVSDTPPEK